MAPHEAHILVLYPILVCAANTGSAARAIKVTAGPTEASPCSGRIGVAGACGMIVLRVCGHSAASTNQCTQRLSTTASSPQVASRQLPSPLRQVPAALLGASRYLWHDRWPVAWQESTAGLEEQICGACTARLRVGLPARCSVCLANCAPTPARLVCHAQVTGESSFTGKTVMGVAGGSASGPVLSVSAAGAADGVVALSVTGDGVAGNGEQ